MTRHLILPVFLLALAGAAFGDAGDPPARVARLNYMTGSVSFRPGTVEDWAEATLNYPVTTGDHLWADQNSGAEMHVGSTALRLSGQTAVEFLNLDDRVAQLSVPQGGLNVRVRNLGDGEVFEIDTPNGAISLLGGGEYRIDVNPDDNSTYVTVRGGEAEVSGAGNPFRVRAGEFTRIGGDPVSSEIGPARAPDGWDQWCMTRDRSEDQAAAASAQYVPREMVGTEDLGANGDWRQDPEYGAVWAPRVSAGWAPYHYGHWAWVEPWGWTWIDDAPWGFAPFHYGRWAYVRGGWVWAPGVMVARPVYAPALVAFVGVGGTSVAWFPLGPREVYVPAYRARQMTVTTVNVRYMNQNVPGAVIAVPQRTFASAQPVGRSAVVVTREQIARAEVVHVAPVTPNREAVLGRAVSVHVTQPPARIQARTVVVRTAPAPSASPRVRPVVVQDRPVAARPNPVPRPTPTVERPVAAERPVQPEVRREAQPERRQERKAEPEQRSQKRDNRKTEDKKKEQ